MHHSRFSLISKNFEKSSDSILELLERDTKFHLTDNLYQDLSLIQGLSPSVAFIVHQVD